MIKLKWKDLFQKYFNITDEHIYSNGEISTEYTVKNNKPINIKTHIYEKCLDINTDVELNDVRVFFHKKKNMIRLVGNFFMNKKLIAVSNALFKCGVIESYTFSRNERLQQSELRLMFKEEKYDNLQG